MHSEVEHRCRAISESLSKYLRVMRCVVVDEVVTVRHRVEHVRSKADNVVILSTNRSHVCLSLSGNSAVSNAD